MMRSCEDWLSPEGALAETLDFYSEASMETVAELLRYRVEHKLPVQP